MDDADLDGDSLPDEADADTDGNGTTDPDRIDRDADGIDDHADASFCRGRRDADTDVDGLIDRYDQDDDNDRIPDCLDGDIDGDGLLNAIEQDAEAVDPCSTRRGSGRVGSSGAGSTCVPGGQGDLPEAAQVVGRFSARQSGPGANGVAAAPFVPPRAA